MISLTAPAITLVTPHVGRVVSLTFGTRTYRYRYAGVISSTTSLSSIPAGAIRLGSVTT